MPVQSPVREKENSTNVGSHTGNSALSVFDTIPISLVLYLAAPYLAGETGDEAIELAHKLIKESKFCSTLDILGEDATNADDCEASVEHYKRLIDAVCAKPVKCEKPRQQMTISFKPSMFSTTAPGEGPKKELDDAFDRILRVTEYAQKKGVNVTLEAEDHKWTSFHLESYFALIEAGYTNLGTVLQTRLFRTQSDLERFDDRTRCRLVIGIYNEPKDISFTEKPKMKQLLIEYARELLLKGTYVELATHDQNTIEQFMREVVIPHNISSSQFEIQFLLGVPRKKLQQDLVTGNYFKGWTQEMSPSQYEHIKQLTQDGVTVRMYLPFGKDKVAGAYCRRRLKGNPNMVSYGIKNLFGIQS